MHIAESVSNRILNVADGVAATQRPAKPMPQIPDPSAAGAAIDAAVRTPVAPAALPAGAESGMLSAALVGDSPAQAATDAAILNETDPTLG